MTIISKPMLEELLEQVEDSLLKLADCKDYPNQHNGNHGWTVSQVIEHLNTYNHWYLPRIKKAMHKSKHPKKHTFKPGWLGNYFVRIVQPGQKKYKAAAAHQPAPQLAAELVFGEFESGQQELLHLIRQAKEKDLNRIRIQISILPLLSLNLGDALRFIVAHQQRHFNQIGHIIQSHAYGRNSTINKSIPDR